MSWHTQAAARQQETAEVAAAVAEAEACPNNHCPPSHDTYTLRKQRKSTCSGVTYSYSQTQRGTFAARPDWRPVLELVFFIPSYPLFIAILCIVREPSILSFISSLPSQILPGGSGGMVTCVPRCARRRMRGRAKHARWRCGSGHATGHCRRRCVGGRPTLPISTRFT